MYVTYSCKTGTQKMFVCVFWLHAVGMSESIELGALLLHQMCLVISKYTLR